MTDLGFFVTFAAIGVIMIAVSLAMAWISRRAMKSHKRQIDDMIREMREVIDEEDGEPPAES